MPMMLTDLLILPAIPAAMYVTPEERKWKCVQSKIKQVLVGVLFMVITVD